jgi:uncharacterized protein YbaR (Trm112 family)
MRCPACGGTLEERAEQSQLRCVSCRVGYPVEDGIPVMLEERALPPEADPGDG